MDVVLFWLVAFTAVTITGISKSGFAGNLGVITVPLLSLVIPLEQAAAMMLPVLIAMDVKVVHLYYKAVNWRVLLAVLPAACIGIAFGAFAMEQLPEQWLQVVLGVVCVLFAVWHTLNRLLGAIPGAGLVWGSLAGFTSTLIHAGGPPINIYFAGKQLPKLQWLATAAVFFGVANIIKVIPYFYLGLWNRHILINALCVLPVAWIGVLLGKRVQGNFDDDTFLFVSRVLVFIAGLLLIFKARTLWLVV